MIFRYLRNANRYSFLQTQIAQLSVLLSCTLYLQSSLDLVDPRVTEDEKSMSVLLCLHELHLYAIDHWIDHLLALLKLLGSRSHGCELDHLLRGLQRLTDMHQNVVALQGSGLHDLEEQDSRQEDDRWQRLNISPTARSLLDRVLVHQQTGSSSHDWPRRPNCKRAAFQTPHVLILRSPAVDPNDNHQDPSLFPRTRCRYQAIVEEIMEMEEPDKQLLATFLLRHASGAFLCRYRNCPRAEQGFRTSEHREKHEESHRPRFQCTHASCGFFGTTFNSRAAMKKHAGQYHDDENTASVPNSLVIKPRGLDDRSLFAFSEVKAKRRVTGSKTTKQQVESLEASTIGPTIPTSSGDPHFATEGSLERSTPYSNARTGQLDKAMSDVYYYPGETPANFTSQPRHEHRDTVSRHKGIFSDRVKAAEANHLISRSVLPAANASQMRSPFSESSHYAADWDVLAALLEPLA